jgi:acyl carrier protein
VNAGTACDADKTLREDDLREASAARLDEVFRTVLELPAGAAVRDTRQESAATWDSLAHVLLVGAIESEFGLQVDAADSLELTSYDAISQFLEERGL